MAAWTRIYEQKGNYNHEKDQSYLSFLLQSITYDIGVNFARGREENSGTVVTCESTFPGEESLQMPRSSSKTNFAPQHHY
jgi:hypothetical protein